MGHLAYLPVYHSTYLCNKGGIMGIPLQNFHSCEDRRERIAEFVRQHGQKLVFAT